MQAQIDKPRAARLRPTFDWDGAMVATLQGDAQAYRQLLEQAARWLRRFFARRLPVDLVDDAVQECLMALHTRRATFTPGRPFLPWLTAIARYKWVDSLRASGRHAADHEDTVVSAIGLRGLLAHLRSSQSEVIRLVKLEGLSIREAAVATGQSEPLVKVNIHRGMLALRSLLGPGAVSEPHYA